jgi:hypothetical protein
MKKPKTYGIYQLPRKVRIHIHEAATKIANWKSPTEIGDGSTMLTEWLTYPYTPEEWIDKCKGWQIELTDEHLRELLGLNCE